MAGMEDRLAVMLAPAAEAMGFSLWGVEFVRAGKHSTLRVYIDHADGVSVNHCAQVSHQISALLDVEDPIQTDYFLEVSSPGMERPFFRAEQFADFIGEQAAVELTISQQGKRKFKGVIAAVDGEQIEFIIDSENFLVKHAAIKKAHLIPQFN